MRLAKCLNCVDSMVVFIRLLLTIRIRYIWTWFFDDYMVFVCLQGRSRGISYSCGFVYSRIS